MMDGTGIADGVRAQMLAMGEAARRAALAVSEAGPDARSRAIAVAAEAVADKTSAILAANAQDVDGARARGLDAAMLDRLLLNDARLAGVAQALREIAAQPDPVGAELAAWTRPNGLRIRRIRQPLGVIGVIYESRPNVTADAGALCLRAGNAAILRGGSESFLSSAALHGCLVDGLRLAGLPDTAIQRVPTTDRAAVGVMLAEMAPFIDVIIPRGGKGLVARVQAEARVPVFAHLEGICHVYIDAAADRAKAVSVTLNAKTRRTGVCGAAECLLIDRAGLETGAAALRALLDAGVEVRGCEETRALDSRVIAAADDDYGREFLASIIAARVVDGVDGAIEHIRRYGSSHTEAILTEDDAAATRFFDRLDSAILLRNASSQFADGGEFGMGAEIGIATGKMHARGPVGAEQLTTFRYLVEGDGTIRH